MGYRVASVAFDANSGEPVASADSHDTLTDIISNPDLTVCPDNCFRPAGLTLDREGRLWMTSDSTGEIYVLQRTGESDSGRFVTPGEEGENAAGTLWRWETKVMGWSVAAGLGLWLAAF